MEGALDKAMDKLRKDVDMIDNIVRGDNGEGLSTKISVVQQQVSDIRKLNWLVLAGVVGLGIERLIALI